jgi:hypothetical protein
MMTPAPPPSDLDGLSVEELLATHTAVLEELRRRQVLRSANNPTGDYTEWLVSKKLNLSLAPPSAKGYDATDSAGMRYQIKGRRISKTSGAIQLSVLRGLSDQSFDFLIAVAFNPNWSIRYALKMPYETVTQLGKFQSHVNGHIMHLRPSIFEYAAVEDISALIMEN